MNPSIITCLENVGGVRSKFFLNDLLESHIFINLVISKYVHTWLEFILLSGFAFCDIFHLYSIIAHGCQERFDGQSR